MKDLFSPTFPFAILCLLLPFQNPKAWADPRQSLLKQLAKQAAHGEAVNFKGMTPKGLAAYQDFQSALPFDRTMWFKNGEEQIALFLSKNDGDSGVIHQIKVEKNGQVTRAAFSVPETEPTAGGQIARHREYGSVGVARRYETLSGSVITTETYFVKEINGKPFRVQQEEYVDTLNRKIQTTYVDGKLEINVVDRESKEIVHQLTFDPLSHNLGGEILGFNIDQGKGLKVYFADNKHIVEYGFSLTPDTRFKKHLNAEQRSRKVLNPEEIRKLGFLAELKVIPARKQAESSIRGMSVDGGTR